MIPPQDPDGGYTFHAGFDIDGDGANGQTGGIACYAPAGMPSLDYLANAGHPGNWWALVTDNGLRSGNPIIQGPNDPAPGAYVSMTSYRIPGYPASDPRSWIDAAAIPGMVVTDEFIRAVPGIVMGCLCSVIFQGVTVNGMVYDVGPAIGEGTIQLAQMLGIPGSPKSGGVPNGVIWRVFPGVAGPAGLPLQPA